MGPRWFVRPYKYQLATVNHLAFFYPRKMVVDGPGHPVLEFLAGLRIPLCGFFLFVGGGPPVGRGLALQRVIAGRAVAGPAHLYGRPTRPFCHSSLSDAAVPRGCIGRWCQLALFPGLNCPGSHVGVLVDVRQLRVDVGGAPARLSDDGLGVGVGFLVAPGEVSSHNLILDSFF